MRHRKRLVVMLKEPQPGRVKTRLGKDIGYVAAAWWFRHRVQDLLKSVARSSAWETVLAVSPDKAGMTSRVWPGDLPKWPQGSGDLGKRMTRVFRNARPGPLVIIGADIPGLRQEDIAAAFRALGTCDAVFGPAPDGGYWLIGLARRRGIPANILTNVRWSTEHALEDTLASLPGHWSVARIATHADVDTVEDLKLLHQKKPLQRETDCSSAGSGI